MPDEIETRWYLSRGAAPGLLRLHVQELGHDRRGLVAAVADRHDARAQLQELREELKHRIAISTVPNMTFDPVECDGT